VQISQNWCYKFSWFSKQCPFSSRAFSTFEKERVFRSGESFSVTFVANGVQLSAVPSHWYNGVLEGCLQSIKMVVI
jgi:hypothetical protein